MRVLVAGGGPVGVFAGLALERRGHDVLLVDRDPGPGPATTWDRRGVMQFHHPHFFRYFVVDALRRETPDVLSALIAAGADLVTVPPPAPPDVLIGMRCRRDTVERQLRAALHMRPALRVHTGHVDAIAHDDGKVLGAVVDGALIPADLVLDATGRAGRLTKDLRPESDFRPSRESAVSRAYQLLPGAEPGPFNVPPGFAADHDGYSALVFSADAGTFTTLIIRRSEDRRFDVLREPAAFDLASAAIPGLSTWTDPKRSAPSAPVRAVANLFNAYRSQLIDGEVPVRGLISVGDAVCITNPKGGRGISTGFLQVEELLALLDAGHDIVSTTQAFDGWCTTNLRPWFDDHVRADRAQQRVWAGLDIDLEEPLASDIVCAAGSVLPELLSTVRAYFRMDALPSALAVFEPQVRELLASGWRPSLADGPSADELTRIAACV